MDYWFFFSYAHSDDGDFLRRFYTDLREEVRQLIGGPKPVINFLDRNEIIHGANWKDSLEQGLKTCRVFVPVYSASYFQAAYCGKEFGAFRERLHTYLQQNGQPIADSLILPVLWSPEANVLPQIPPSINGIQYTDDDLLLGYPPEYKTEGVAQLVKRGASETGALHDQYVRFIHRLATNLQDAANKLQLPAADSLTPLSQITSVFPTSSTNAAKPMGEGPRYVQFIFVAGKQSELQQAQRQTLKFYSQNGGADWQPYLDAYPGTARMLAAEIINALPEGSTYEEVTSTTNLRQQVEEAAKQDKVVVVVVDTWTLRIDEYYNLVNPLDDYSAVNCITVIAWNTEDLEAEVYSSELQTAVKATFTNKSVQPPANFLSEKITSYDSFKKELIETLSQVQMQVAEIAKIKKSMQFVKRFKTTSASVINPLR
jgi:FxsC-like protein